MTREGGTPVVSTHSSSLVTLSSTRREVLQGLGRPGHIRWSPNGRFIAAYVHGVRANYFVGQVIVEAASGASFFYGDAVAHDWSPLEARLLVNVRATN